MGQTLVKVTLVPGSQRTRDSHNLGSDPGAQKKNLTQKSVSYYIYFIYMILYISAIARTGDNEN